MLLLSAFSSPFRKNFLRNYRLQKKIEAKSFASTYWWSGKNLMRIFIR